MTTLRVPYGTPPRGREWEPPPSAVSASLVNSTDGSIPKLGTEIHIWRDQSRLHVLFHGEDDGLVATLRVHDSDLWTEDVFEVFLAPGRPEEYFELEVNPLGTIFDARVHSPDRSRSSMTVDRGWTCIGLAPAVKVVLVDGRSVRLSALLSVPFASLGVTTPTPGTEWRANFYRIDRHEAGDSFTAWAPTMADPPDFHRPDQFGLLTFD